MNCPRCHQAVNAGEKYVCEHCGFEVDRAPLPINNYHHSPIKRGVRQGLLIIVFVFLLAAVIQTLTSTLQLPRYSGDIVAVLGLIAGIFRMIQTAVFSKKI